MRNALSSGLAVVVFAFAAWGAASSTGLPATLESKAKAAFVDISKAKTALNGGKSKTSDSYLAKAESLLASVLGKGGGSASSTAQGQQNPTAVSQAESEAAKLDPSLAAKFGIGKQQQPAQESGDAGTAASPGQASGAPTQESTLAKLEGVYQKVTAARTLLQAGNKSQAKSLLDQIPSSPLALLKSASGL